MTTDLDSLLASPAPILALAPMQDVTDLAFWRLIPAYGGPDLYFTEYFRVYATSNLNREILKSITENPTGKPAVAQMIGNDIPSLVRTARELQEYPVAAVDLKPGLPRAGGLPQMRGRRVAQKSGGRGRNFGSATRRD